MPQLNHQELEYRKDSSMTKSLVDNIAFQEALGVQICLNLELMSDDEINTQLKILVEAYEQAKQRRNRIPEKLWEQLEDIPNEGDGY
jgi:hypothetical protein